VPTESVLLPLPPAPPAPDESDVEDEVGLDVVEDDVLGDPVVSVVDAVDAVVDEVPVVGDVVVDAPAPLLVEPVEPLIGGPILPTFSDSPEQPGSSANKDEAARTPKPTAFLI
jgi:hypothetical protein